MKRVFILLLAAVLLTSCSVGQSEASLRKKSTTYISSTIFESVPTFEVTSNDVHNGAWDDKVTNSMVRICLRTCPGKRWRALPSMWWL